MKIANRAYQLKTDGQFVLPWADYSVDRKGDFVIDEQGYKQMETFWAPIRARRAAYRKALRRTEQGETAVTTTSEPKLFDILTDLIATADVLTEQVAQIKRNHHLVDQMNDPTPEPGDRCNGQVFTTSGWKSLGDDETWWNNRRLERVAGVFVESD